MTDGPFRSLAIAVLTIIDDGDTTDRWADALLTEQVVDSGHRLVGWAFTQDDSKAIATHVQSWIDAGDVDAVFVIDCSTFSFGTPPPDVILTDGPSRQRHSQILPHPSLGWIGLVDLRTPLAADCDVQIDALCPWLQGLEPIAQSA